MTKKILTLQENTKGRDFVVGDIHGEFGLLEQALAAVDFDPEKDRLICVGDLVDRGPNSPDCLYYLAQPWFYTVRGNHEEIFMRFYKDGWLDIPNILDNIVNGLGWMLWQDTDTLDDIRAAFEELPLVIEIQTENGPVGFVHADVPENMGWAEFKENILNGDKATRGTALWSRKRVKEGNPHGVTGAWRIFFGHTPMEGGAKILGNCFFIDTGAVFKSFDPEESTGDLFLTLVDIKASAQDISNPVPSKNPLVRTATAKPRSTPTPKPPSFKPPAP